MANGYNVAVAGATGAVGVEMVKTLEKRNFPVKSLKLLASARSAGKTMKFKGEDVVIEEEAVALAGAPAVPTVLTPVASGKQVKKTDKAVIDYSKCIRCYCCHEMCPQHVIDIRRFSLFRH